MRKPDESGFDREIAHHLDQLTADHIARGLSPAEARRRARITFGGTEQVKQQMREVHLQARVQSLRSNFAAAFRFIRRSPSFAVTIIVTLALAIGANSAVFSALDAILLRPLPFPHANELVRIDQHDQKNKSALLNASPLRLEDWNHLNHTFQAISGYYTGDASLTSGSLPEKITVAFVAPRFLQLWQIAPALGRDFTPQEEKFTGPPAVLVSHRFWLNHLNGDPAALFKPIKLSGAFFTVIGVLPASFLAPDPTIDIYEMNAVDAPYGQDRTNAWFTVVGRMKAGVTLFQAGADLAAVQQDLGKQYPASDSQLTVELQALKSVVVGGTGGSLWLLYGAVTLLLAIACMSIAALMLARTAEREQEIAIRYSLGASRSAIVGQLLTEVFVLALAGSAAGLAIAAAAPHLFTLFARDLPRAMEITLNLRIVLYTLITGLACTFACGLIPAIRGTRRNLAGSIARGTRTQVSARNPWQWLLIGAQVTLAVTLLIGSGLLLRSFEALNRVNPGFSPDHVLTLRISAGWGETADMGKLTQRIDRVLDALRSTPGVEAAATAATVPGNSFGYPGGLKILETSSTDTTQAITADSHYVSNGYFATLKIPVLQGEACPSHAPADPKAANSIVVNRSFAAKYFSGPPLGYHLQSVDARPGFQPGLIRGVVGDAREQGLETAAEPTIYWCFSAPDPDPWFLIRTHGDPAALAKTLRQRIQLLEPARSVFAVMPLTERIDSRQAESRLRTILVTLFALTATALVTIGLYGTISYLGRMRRREVGLRLALGAMPREIMRMFLLQGLRVTLAGCLAGLALSAALTGILVQAHPAYGQDMLYAVSPLDPATYCGVALFILLIALLATLVPSRRAAAVDPVEMLREQ